MLISIKTIVLLTLLASLISAAPRPNDPDEICRLPPIFPLGFDCVHQPIPMWTYNAATENCEQFLYKGCWATANLFRSRSKCQAHCGQAAILKRSTRQAYPECLLPLSPGHCRAHFDRYYFDRASGRCQPFVYSGCGNNGNNFQTLNDCQRRCR